MHPAHSAAPALGRSACPVVVVRCGAPPAARPVTPPRAGNFSSGDVHGWVTALLPELPPTLPPGQDGASYVFQNTLLGTQLMCRCVAASPRGAG